MTATTWAMGAPSAAWCKRGLVIRVVLDGQVDVNADRPAPLLAQVTEQTGAPGEYLRVDSADGREQPQVRAAQPLGCGDRQQDGRTRVGDLVHGMAEAGQQLAGLAGAPYRRERDGVPAGVVVGQRIAGLGQDGGQEPAGVLGDPEEAGAAAEQAGRDGTLDRLRRAQV